MLKKCVRCKKEKGKELFRKDAYRKDGLCIYCLFCMKDKRRDWYLKNAEAVKAKVRKWKADNVLTVRAGYRYNPSVKKAYYYSKWQWIADKKRMRQYAE